VDDLSRRLPYFSAAGIRDAVLSFPECRDFPVDRPDIARVLEIAAAIDGLPRHASVHVGGLVVADRPLTDYAPLQVATKGIVITQYEAGAIEALGLVKMDILAQRSLSILATAVKEIEKNHGLKVDPAAVEDGDPAAAAMLERGDTFGCFQIESPGMRNLLKMMGARRRMDVILGLSLIRPGPASSGMKERFVRRRRGLEPPECLHPALREVLGGTYGVMLYQEDVIRVAHAAAGFTLAEGDRLRKDLSKGAAPAALEGWHTRLVRGAVARGARRDQAETLWDRVTRFAAYSYCKAHACTYGEIAYSAVYLRARWPAEFAAAVLANQAGYYERRAYLEDARRRGCPILGPDVNASGVEPSAEWSGGGPARRVAVRMGLMDVRGLTERAMRNIVAARGGQGPYRSAADLAARVSLSREEAENLAMAGALDSLAANRPAALWQVHAAIDSPRPRGPLFEGACGPDDVPPGPPLEDYSPLQKLLLEEHLLGMTPSASPMAVYRPLIISNLRFEISDSPANGKDRGGILRFAQNDREGPSPPPSSPPSSPPRERREILPIADLPSRAGEVVTVAGLLFAERRTRTKDGEFMKFISLEDETGIVEAVLLPDAYQRLGGRLTTRGPYVVTGTVEDHLGAISVIVTDLRLVQPAADQAAPSPGAVGV
jgi:DNA polymerase III alpha subunit